MVSSDDTAVPDAVEERNQTRRSLKHFNRNMLLRSVFDTACAPGSFLFVAFVLALGVPGESMGRVAAMASLACIAQVLTLPLAQRAASRKRFIIAAGLLEPLAVAVAILGVPLLPPAWRLTGLMIAVFSAAAFVHMTRPGMDDWLYSTIPGALRGRFLGRRIQMLGVVSITATLSAGWLGDWLGHGGPSGLACVLAGATLFGVLAILELRHVREIQPEAGNPVSLLAVPDVLRVKPYRRFVLGYILFNIPFLFGLPFYQVFNQGVVHMTTSQIASMSVGYILAKMVVARRLGRLVDRWGVRRFALLCGPCYALFFLGLCTAGPGRSWPVVLSWGLVGAVDAAYAVAYQAGLYAVVPERGQRSTFFAVANLAGLGFYSLGALLAEALIRRLGGTAVALGPLVLTRYNILYAGCGLLMFGTTFAGLLWPRRAA